MFSDIKLHEKIKGRFVNEKLLDLRNRKQRMNIELEDIDENEIKEI